MVHEKHHHSHKHKHGHHHNREGDGGHHHRRSHHHESSHKDHKPSITRVRYACKQDHRDCAGENTWRSTGEIAGPGGNRMTVSWKPCRADEARGYIENLSAAPPKQPHDGVQAAGSREAGPPPAAPTAQTQQAAPPPQGPQGQVPAGPSWTQAPAAAEGTQQPVPQQEANTTGGGNTVTGSTAPPLGQTSMTFEAYAQATRYSQPTSYAGGYGGQYSAGEYGGGYDMSFPEDMSYDENMDFDEYYGGGGDSFSGMPMGSGGGRRAPSTVAAPVEARAEWVETRPENLYHSDETDGVVKDQPYKALPPHWNQPH